MKKVIYALIILSTTSLCTAKYSGGSGTLEAPYHIATPNDLYTLADDINDYDKHFVFTADIDLDPNLPGRRTLTTALIALDNSTAGSFDGTPFTGTFDGNNCNILNLTIDTHGANNNHLGLFGKTDANCIITNLSIEDINIIGGDDSRYIGGLAGINGGSISDCCATGNFDGHWYTGGLAGYNLHGSITNSYAAGDVSGDVRVGGLVGLNFGIISDCCATGNMTGDDVVGGLVGYNSGDITSCHSTGDASSDVRVGGLAGYNAGSITNCDAAGLVTGTNDYVGGLTGSNVGSIESCHSTGDVSGNNEKVGGLVGWNATNSSISNCYATGDVNGRQHVGGLVGSNYGDVTICYATGLVTGTHSHVGGLAGTNYKGSIASCYSTGDVSGDGRVGGLVGWNFNTSSVSNCYATGDANGTGRDIGGLVGRNDSASITNCYAAGFVSGHEYVGGLLGYYSSGAITNSYFLDPNDGGGPVNGFGTPLTDGQMRQQASFENWDFNDIWDIYEEQTYPWLQWEYQNSAPIANAGPNQVLCATADGFAEVTLDASDSNDPDGDALTYYWSWTVDSNDYYVETNEPNVLVELPVGQHIIELLVYDGLADSEPDTVVITVVPPLEAEMKFTPQINCNSKGNWVKAHFVLPEGFLPQDVDVNAPAIAEPMGIESESIKVLGAGTGPVRLEITFDREAFCETITETGEVEITVIGSLTAGRYFYATDTIKIKP